MLQPHIPQQDFVTNNANAAGMKNNDTGYSLFVFDIRYEKKTTYIKKNTYTRINSNPSPAFINIVKIV